MVLAVACGGNGGEPGLLGDDDTETLDAASTATATATTSSPPVVTDSSVADTGPACPTVDSLLAGYGLASTCGPCIDSQCTSVLSTCDSDCSCPTAAVGYVQCISLGANSSTCASVASQATNPQTVLAVLQCTTICQDECHQAGDAGDGGGGDAASDASQAAGDGGGDASR